MLDHDQAPERGFLEPKFLAEMRKKFKTPYHESLLKLFRILKGRIVKESKAGTSGFFLIFEDESWVVSYLSETTLIAKMGQGKLSPEDIGLIGSANYADFHYAPEDDEPYSWESCDLTTEISRAHGKPISGISLGENSFNFCFPTGRELDVHIVSDAKGNAAIRVFWEQW